MKYEVNQESNVHNSNECSFGNVEWPELRLKSLHIIITSYLYTREREHG